MPKFLRKIQYKTNWDPGGEFSSYIPAGEAPADALQDLETSDNTLSIWQIDDAETNLDRVLAAIASLGDHVQKIDYLLLDTQHFSSLGLETAQNPGETNDLEANDKWHFDIVHLSAANLARLANLMFAHGKTGRKQDKLLLRSLIKAIDDGFVDVEKLKPGLQAKIGKKT